MIGTEAVKFVRLMAGLPLDLGWLELGGIGGVTIDLLGIKDLLRLRESQWLAGLVAKGHGAVETGVIPYMATGPALDVHTQPDTILVVVDSDLADSLH